MENGSQTDIVLLIVAGCLGMLILVVSIILFVVYYQKKVLTQKNDFQKQLLSATVQVEEKERERIAKNIHDDIGTLLSLIRVNISRSLNATDAEIAKELMRKNAELIDESIHAVRRAIRDLTPATLHELGYIKALEELAQQVNGSQVLVMEIAHENPVLHLHMKDELQLYRLTKELLNNIIKHTGASHMKLGFHKFDATYKLRIDHNGKGISNEAMRELSRKDKGLGLKSIESRAQLINAKVNYGKEDERHQAFVEVNIEYE